MFRSNAVKQFLFSVLSRTLEFTCNLPVKRLRTQENEHHKVSLMNRLVLSQTRKSLQHKSSVITFFCSCEMADFCFSFPATLMFSYYQRKRKNVIIKRNNICCFSKSRQWMYNDSRPPSINQISIPAANASSFWIFMLVNLGRCRAWVGFIQTRCYIVPWPCLPPNSSVANDGKWSCIV